MDQIILNLGHGLGLQNIIGWFIPIFIGSVNILPSILTLFYYADKSAEFNKQRTLRDTSHSSYDFIVVGGGSAGSVVANRLSKSYNVLLIERGGEPNPLTAVPALEGILSNRPQTDYSYRTVSQTNSCLAMNNRESLWLRGKGLGGTSVINSMAFYRGHPYDYDLWAHWTKDPRWSYESLVPFFLRSESYCFECDPPNSPTNKNFHGTSGELHVTKPTVLNLVKEFLDGMAWAGLPNADLNAPFSQGAEAVTYTQRFGRRMSTRDAFINPIRNRQTLKIIKYAQVYKVLIDRGQAFGVEYEQFGNIVQATATKEVILSAGAIDSPKILLLSGIGPSDHLKSVGIPVTIASPFVGGNLQDHIGTFVGPFTINKPLSYLPGRDLNLEAANEFLQNGTGTFTLSFAHAVSVLTSTKAEFPDFPDIQMGLSANGISEETAPGIADMYNIRQDVLNEFYGPLVGKDAFSLIVDYCRPRSRGYLRLKSSNYKDNPVIDPNYYSVERDMEVMLEAIKRALEIVEKAPSFRALNATLSPIAFPMCRHVVFRSDAYFECFARHVTLSLYHFAGTVRMGSDAATSVLDSELRVRGVHGLRVIDASIMPFITTMNTNAPSILIGERGSQFIVDFWDSQRRHEHQPQPQPLQPVTRLTPQLNHQPRIKPTLVRNPPPPVPSAPQPFIPRPFPTGPTGPSGPTGPTGPGQQVFLSEPGDSSQLDDLPSEEGLGQDLRGPSQGPYTNLVRNTNSLPESSPQLQSPLPQPQALRQPQNFRQSQGRLTLQQQPPQSQRPPLLFSPGSNVQQSPRAPVQLPVQSYSNGRGGRPFLVEPNRQGATGSSHPPQQRSRGVPYALPLVSNPQVAGVSGESEFSEESREFIPQGLQQYSSPPKTPKFVNIRQGGMEVEGRGGAFYKRTSKTKQPHKRVVMVKRVKHIAENGI